MSVSPSSIPSSQTLLGHERLPEYDNEKIYLTDEEAKDFIDEVVSERCSLLPVRLYDTFTEEFIIRSKLSETVKRQTLQTFALQNPRPSLYHASDRRWNRARDDQYHLIKRIVLSYTRFAILSHTWGSDELTYEGVRDGGKVLMDNPKFLGFRSVAAKYQCQYIWLDTVCINKASSSELDESIRSMFMWYRMAYVCIVFLETKEPLLWTSDRWFKRGWTLQELLAPKRIVFVGPSWAKIFPVGLEKKVSTAGDKWTFDLVRKFERRRACAYEPEVDIEQYDTDEASTHMKSLILSLIFVTGIPPDILLVYKPSPSKARAVFKYMQKRRTTVPEDAAYCLFGLLGIVLTPAYGEGREHALYRLQAACAERSDERNLFLWNVRYTPPSQFNSMLPKDPFAGPNRRETIRDLPVTATTLWKHCIQEGSTDARVDISFTFTNSGLRIKVILHDISRNGEVAGKVIRLAPDSDVDRALCKLAILGTYSQGGVNNQVFAIILVRVGAPHSRQYRRIPCTINPLSLPPIEVLLNRKPEKVFIM